MLLIRFVLPFVLALGAASASASEWELIGEASDSKTYFKASSMRRYGEDVRVWILRDMKVLTPIDVGGEFRSLLAHFEIKCKEEEWRTRTYVFYEGHMGEGKAVKSLDVMHPFSSLVPSSIAAGLHRDFCRR